MTEKKKIKFSHQYTKVVAGKFPMDAVLLQVLIADKRELSEDFIRYDTEYVDERGRSYYPLPDGKLLVLLLIDGAGFMFTTLRRWTKEKETYYRRMQGQTMRCVLFEEVTIR
jgi:hypothetical protein